MVVGALAAVPELSFLHLPPQLGKHETAVWGFGLLGKEARPAVPALSRLLGDKDPEVRATAARCLAVITPRGPEGVPAMIGLLRDRDPQVQAAAAAWLAEIGPAAAEAVPALVRVVMDRNGMATNQWFVGHAIEQAARALGAIGPAAKAAVPALEEVTNDLRLTRSEPAAAVALVKINQGSWQPFFDRLKDTSDAQRWARTADQVSRLGAEAEPAIRLLLGGLRQTNQVILGGAITAIERLHRRPDLCLGPLISHLSPADPNRGKVLLTLGKFGLEARPAAREVARCLRDRERTIREAATNVLRQIDPDAPDLKPKRP
jgi:HEAT repeat protein